MRSTVLHVFALFALLASGAYAARLLTDQELRTVGKLQERKLQGVDVAAANSTGLLLHFISNVTELSKIAKLVEDVKLHEELWHLTGTYFLPTDEAINASASKVAEWYGNAFRIEELLDQRGILYHTIPTVLLPTANRTELSGNFSSYASSGNNTVLSLTVDLKFNETGFLVNGTVEDHAGDKAKVVGMIELSNDIVVYLIDKVMFFFDEISNETASNFTTVADVLHGEASLTGTLAAFNATGVLPSMNASLANGTVFLPSNDAWHAFDAFLMKHMNMSLEELTDAQIADILAYHMVPDSPLQFGIGPLPENFNATLPTLLEGQNVTASLQLVTRPHVPIYNTLQVTDVHGNSALVLDYYLLGENVAAYIIDGVLFPKFHAGNGTSNGTANSTAPAANETIPAANGTANGSVAAEVASRRHRLF